MFKKILFTVISIIFIANFHVSAEVIEEYLTFNEKAVVLEVEQTEETHGDYTESIQNVELEVLSGDFKGDIINVENVISGNPTYDVIVESGDRVILEIQQITDSEYQFYILQFERDTYLYVLIALFILLLVAIGGWKGLKTVITLALTMFMIFKVLLPLMLEGYNPIILTVLVSTLIIIVTILIVSGINKKSYAAIIGTVFGVIIAGVLAYIAGKYSNLTGLSSNEASMLLYSPLDIELNFRHLLYSGIILGALGAVMDVSMSIASSIDEIYKANENQTRKELFKSGMNVGKDIMGTMSNTLILAYTGSALTLILLYMVNHVNYLKVINFDLIATEIIRSFSGSIGLILAIPFTALVASMLLKKKKSE